jgi:5-formyltetrahydrofolate cyclo-ligase
MVPHFFQAGESRELATAKRKLREAMLLKRQHLPHAASASASESVARHYADHPILAFCHSFAGYRAIRGELNVMPVFEQMQRFAKISALPRMHGANEPLTFHAWQRGDALVRHSTLGVEEPDPDAAKLVPDVILVPTLAFDGDGYRLGYGAGYYDRTLAALRSEASPPLCIGVAYSIQEVEHVPTSDHDQPLDGIITEHGVSIFNTLHPKVSL